MEKCKRCGKRFEAEDGFTAANGGYIYCSEQCLNRETVKGYNGVSNFYGVAAFFGAIWAYVQYDQKGEWWLFFVVIGIMFLGRRGLKWVKGTDCGTSQVKFWLGILFCCFILFLMLRKLTGL